MIRQTSVFAALVLILPAGALHAQGPQGAGFLQAWDRSGSGTVTLAGMRERRAEIFDMFDTDGDGRLEAAEQAAMAEVVAAQGAVRQERQAEARAARQAERPGRGRGADAAGGGPGAAIHAAMAPRFNDLDGDGIVTRAEFLAATEGLFASLDRRGAGRLAPEGAGRGRR